MKNKYKNQFENEILFSKTEYQTRVKKVQTKMAHNNIDLLLIASPANQFYLTGYDGWSFYTPQMVVVSINEEQPYWIGRQMDSVGAKFTAYLDKNHIIPYPDVFVASQSKHPMNFLVDFIKEKKWHKKNIGVEMDEYYYTAKWHNILTSNLPEAEFKDAFLLVNWIRMIKSNQEIDYMKDAGKIANLAMKKAMKKADVGVRQCDVIAELYRFTTGGTKDIGGTFTCKPPNAMVGEYCSAPHLSWTDKKLKKNEIFYIEMGGAKHRYHVPLARCIYMGKVPDKIKKISYIICEGLNAVLEKVKPGTTGHELEDTWKKVINKYGLEKDSRIGYPVGIGFPPTWGELTTSFRKGDKNILKENMTFHCIPALWLKEYGIVISETFVVRKQGAERLTNYQQKLFDLETSK
jgi:Xaa-Pro aminopeptidase